MSTQPMEDTMPTDPTTEDQGTPYQRLVVVGPNLPHQAKATFHVHAMGCADLHRGWIGRIMENPHNWWHMTANSLADVEAEVYDFAPAENEDYKLGDYQTEFHFAPCVTLPLATEDQEVRA